LRRLLAVDKPGSTRISGSFSEIMAGVASPEVRPRVFIHLFLLTKEAQTFLPGFSMHDGKRAGSVGGCKSKVLTGKIPLLAT
jgi:hypothetical protein